MAAFTYRRGLVGLDVRPCGHARLSVGPVTLTLSGTVLRDLHGALTAWQQGDARDVDVAAERPDVPAPSNADRQPRATRSLPPTAPDWSWTLPAGEA